VSLALFAVTLGEGISNHIDSLFASGELAEGYILDQVASFAADELAQIAGRRFEADRGVDDQRVLPYSPGYCGWHVSGQRALFDHLQPEEIGITINDSCLMHPIKSVSGVLVLAPIEAHSFSPAFPCCATCTTLECQDRIASLRSQSESA
jgi:cobalamin-dependent methionine synthase I